MTEVRSYRAARPCWVDCATTDPAAAQRFYAELFGWQIEDMGPEAGHYGMARLRGLDVAAVYPLNEQQRMNNVPPNWLTHFAADDVDAVAKTVESAGGRLLAGPFDVMTAGRMAVVADPQGAVFGLWQAGDHIGSRLRDEPGTPQWTELHTTDEDAARQFYPQVFGWTANVNDMGGMTYTEFQLDGESVTGMLRAQPGTPPNWLAYFAVDDVDASVARGTDLGGTVLVPPSDFPGGRFAVARDPQGAVFGLLRMAG